MTVRNDTTAKIYYNRADFVINGVTVRNIQSVELQVDATTVITSFSGLPIADIPIGSVITLSVVSLDYDMEDAITEHFEGTYDGGTSLSWTVGLVRQ